MAFEHGVAYNLTASANDHIANYLAAIYTHIVGTSARWTVVSQSETLRAVGTIEVDVTAGGTGPQVGDVLTIGGVPLTAVSGTPSTDDFDISSGTNSGIAEAIRIALNLSTNSFTSIATARRPRWSATPPVGSTGFWDHVITSTTGVTTASDLIGTVTINAAGTGYVAGDLVRHATGNFRKGVVKITTVDSSGGVTGIVLVDRGNNTTNPTLTNATTENISGSDNGSGLTLDTVMGGGAFVDVDSVVAGTSGNSVVMNVTETNAGSFLLNGNVGGPENLFGGAASHGLGSQHLVIRPVSTSGENFDILIKNTYPQNGPSDAFCVVAINPDGSSDPWENAELPINQGGAANNSGVWAVVDPEAATAWHMSEIMILEAVLTINGGLLSFTPNTEFIWVEYPDAVTWLAKNAGLSATPRGFHAGKVLAPMYTTDITDPPAGQAIEGLGVIGAAPHNTNPSSNGRFWNPRATPSYSSNRFRVGTPGDGNTQASPITGVGRDDAAGTFSRLSSNTDQIAWLAGAMTSMTSTATTLSTFRIGTANQVRPRPLLIRCPTTGNVLGQLKYVKHLPPSNPLNKYQSGGTDLFLYVGHLDANTAITGIHIENGFDPKP